MFNQPGSNALVTHWFPRTAAILALAVLASACGGADDDHPGRVNVDSADSTSNELEKKTTRNGRRNDASDRKECDRGDAEECTITLPRQGSVEQCVQGVRYCDDGRWSDCEVD